MDKKKKSSSNENTEVQDIPTVNEDSTSLGEIKINHKVVANIVQLATMEVEGVAAVIGSKIVDKIEGMFREKKPGGGIQVEEDENGNYLISIQVVLSFGVELAKTAYEIQKAVREHVRKMTNKQVAKVNVIIEEIKMPETEEPAGAGEDWSEGQHTD